MINTEMFNWSFKILKLDRNNISVEKIKNAYYQLLYDWHSNNIGKLVHDLNLHLTEQNTIDESISANAIETFEDQFQQYSNHINQAYEILIESDYFSEEEKNRFSKENEKILNSEEFKKFEKKMNKTYGFILPYTPSFEQLKEEWIYWTEQYSQTYLTFSHEFVMRITICPEDEIQENKLYKDFRRCVNLRKMLFTTWWQKNFHLFDENKKIHLKIIWFKIFKNYFVPLKEFKKELKNELNKDRLDSIKNVFQIIGICILILTLILIIAAIIYSFFNKKKITKTNS